MTKVECQPSIVNRLRDRDAIVVAGLFHAVPVMRDAADEIERLRKALEDQEQAWRDREEIGNESGQALVNSLKAQVADQRMILDGAFDKGREYGVSLMQEQVDGLRAQLANAAGVISDIAPAVSIAEITSLKARVAELERRLKGAQESLCLADKMISEHIEKFEDFDYEPHQVPAGLASLRTIEHHLMGSLILDEDISSLNPEKPK